MRFLFVIVAAALLSACAGRAGNEEDAKRSLIAANQAYDEALINQDAAALQRIYADDFQIIDDDAKVHSKADQIRFMTKELDLLSARTDDVKVRMLGTNAALLTGRFTGRYKLAGKESDFIERYTSVWTRDGNDWRLSHEHSSVVPPRQ